MRRALALSAAALLAATLAHAATISIVNNDGPGEGFNDPTVAAPVGGNPGTTIGAQRLAVFQHAADIWAGILPNTVNIIVTAQFDPLTCTTGGAVLGSAGPTSVFRNFTGAPLTATWYHVALANRLAGSDLNTTNAEINATFNSSLGQTGCLDGFFWYYGFDGNEGGSIELLPVVLHELGHGLGFSTTTSGSTGNYLGGFPSAYDHFLLDPATGLHWDAESPAQRVSSAITCNGLVWTGAGATAQAPDFLGPRPVLRVTAPAPVAGEYQVGAAAFGPAPSAAGVTGPVVLVNDTFGNPTNACESISNDLTGKIAFLDRGTCGFTVKVKNAQLAGAIGVIVADTVAGCPPAGMGGADASILIPSVRITQSDAALLRAQLGSGLTATLISDPTRRAGADAAGHVRLYTPNPFQSGSSVSHWDTSAEPSLLMEPAITTGLSSSVDLTRAAFADLGWFAGSVGVPAAPPVASRLEPGAPNPTAGTTAIAYTLAKDEVVDLRVFDLSGREIAMVQNGPMTGGRHLARWDGLDHDGRRVPPGVYRYRLRTRTIDESRTLVVAR